MSTCFVSPQEKKTDVSIGNRIWVRYRMRVVKGRLFLSDNYPASVWWFGAFRLPIKDARFSGQGANPGFSKSSVSSRVHGEHKIGESIFVASPLYIKKTKYPL
jgi:hypothetical protein